MKVYDATCVQVCALCGFTMRHNKQGRFTHVQKSILNARSATT